MMLSPKDRSSFKLPLHSIIVWDLHLYSIAWTSSVDSHIKELLALILVLSDHYLLYPDKHSFLSTLTSLCQLWVINVCFIFMHRWEVPMHNLVKILYANCHIEDTDPRFLKLQPVFRCSRLNFGERQRWIYCMGYSDSICLSPHFYQLSFLILIAYALHDVDS